MEVEKKSKRNKNRLFEFLNYKLQTLAMRSANRTDLFASLKLVGSNFFLNFASALIGGTVGYLLAFPFGIFFLPFSQLFPVYFAIFGFTILQIVRIYLDEKQLALTIGGIILGSICLFILLLTSSLYLVMPVTIFFYHFGMLLAILQRSPDNSKNPSAFDKAVVI